MRRRIIEYTYVGDPSYPAQTLQECRTLAAERLSTLIPDVMDKVDDALFDLADKSESNQIQTVYFTAMREVRLRRGAIEAAFPTRLARAVSERIARARPAASTDSETEGLDASTLLLLDDDELEESVAVAGMAGKIRSACKGPLYLLDRRIGFLLDAPDLEGDANPLAPEVICGAFKDACECIEASIEVKLLILKLFDRFVMHEIQPLYDAINAHLVSRDVLPDLRPRVEVRRNPAATRRPEPVDYSSAAPAPGPPAGGGGAQSPTLALLNGLQSLMQAGAPTALEGTPCAPLITGLTAIQERAATGAGTVDGGVPGPGAGPALAFDLRSLKGGGLARMVAATEGTSPDVPLGERGEMLIDIVAMMFDFILDDESLAPAMRALIGRLQIPVLKVALLDRTLFSRRFHPVRRLLNAVAEAAFGWEHPAGADDGLYRKVDELIHRILNEFEDDIAIFSDVLEELEAYLAEEERERQRQIERQRRALARRGRLDEAKAVVKGEILRVLEGVAVAPIVKRFLTRYWGGYLVVTHVKHGPDSERWVRALETMDLLLWSLRPKETPDERKCLIASLPALLERVNDGLERASIPANERDELVAVLARRHAELVRAPAPVGAASAPGEIAPGPVLPAGPGEALVVPSEPGPRPERALLADAIERANRLVHEAQAADPALMGMGTTLVTAVLRDDRIHYAHVGDSRLYRLRSGRLIQLTRDHSLAQELIDKGFYTPEEAHEQVSKNLVTRGLGIEPEVEPDLGDEAALPGDVYLLCSDGLSDMIEAPELEAIVERHRDDLEQLADTLIETANAHGGHDNISAVLARVRRAFPSRKRWYVSRSLEGKVQVAARTDVGRRRSLNEDSIAIDPENGILVVADGMGGLRAGEVASTLAARTLMEELSRELLALDSGLAPAEREERAGVAQDEGVARPAAESEDVVTLRMLGLLDRVDVDLERIVLDGMQVPDAGAREPGAIELPAASPTGPRWDEDDPELLAFTGDSASGDEHDRAVRALAVGKWVDLELEDGRRSRARLSWVNRATGVYLFTNRRGLQVAERTAHALAVELRRGSARILESVPLYERAVTSLLEHLRSGTDGR